MFLLRFKQQRGEQKKSRWELSRGGESDGARMAKD